MNKLFLFLNLLSYYSASPYFSSYSFWAETASNAASFASSAVSNDNSAQAEAYSATS